jgi:hypothetical protein
MPQENQEIPAKVSNTTKFFKGVEKIPDDDKKRPLILNLKSNELVTYVLNPTNKDEGCTPAGVDKSDKIKFCGTTEEIHDASQIYNSLIRLSEEGIKLRNHTDTPAEIDAFRINVNNIFSNFNKHKIIDTDDSKLRLCNAIKGLRNLIRSLHKLGLVDLFLNHPEVLPPSTPPSLQADGKLIVGGAKKRSSKKSSKKSGSKKSGSKKAAKRSGSKKSRSKK